MNRVTVSATSLEMKKGSEALRTQLLSRFVASFPT